MPPRKRTKAEDAPQGFRGRQVDPEPNSAYTLTGKAAEEAESATPTPEPAEAPEGDDGGGA